MVDYSQNTFLGGTRMELYHMANQLGYYVLGAAALLSASIIAAALILKKRER